MDRIPYPSPRPDRDDDIPPPPPGFVLEGSVPPPPPGFVIETMTGPEPEDEPAQRSFLDAAGNVARGIGERAADLAGGLTRVGGMAAAGVQRAGIAAEQRRIAEGKELPDWMPKGAGQAQATAAATTDQPVTFEVERKAHDLADTLRDADLGYEEMTSWEDFKDAPVRNFIPFALEQGLISTPDMAAALTALPVYVAARTGELGDQRAENNNVEDATFQDLIAVLPASVGAALLERFGAKGMLGIGDEPAKRLTQVPGKIALAAGKEAGTEALQEGLESAATTVGTEKGFDPAATAEQMAAGAVGGAGFGGAVRGVTATGEAVLGKGDRPAAEEQPAAPIEQPEDIPPPPDGFEIEPPVATSRILPETEPPAGEAVEPTGLAPASQEGRASPAPSLPPIERAVLRRMGTTDDMIDAMSPEERSAELALAKQSGVRVNKRMVEAAEAYEQARQPAQPPASAIPPEIRPETPPAPAAPVQSPPEQTGTLTTPTLSGERREPDLAGFEREIGLTAENDMLRTLGDGEGTRARPVKVASADDIDLASTRVATNPSEAQKAAGNYRKGHVRVAGLDVTIETPKGAVRSGRDKGGNEWSVEMPAAYGYVKRTTGADGDQVDVYVGDDLDSKRVYVIDQLEGGRFDEHKAIVGVRSIGQARDLYTRAFSDGRGGERMGAITPMAPAEFKKWLAEGNTQKPLRFGKGERTNERGFPITKAGDIKKPESLIEFIARNGGIQDQTGELQAIGLTDRKTGFVSGAGRLVRPNGLTPDRAREMAVEAGYLADAPADQVSTSDLRQLYDALDRDAASRDQFSRYDDDWAAEWRAERSARSGMTEADFEAAQEDPAARERLIAEIVDLTGLAADDPFVNQIADVALSTGLDIDEAAERAAFQANEADGVGQPEGLDIPFFGDEGGQLAQQPGAALEGGSPVRAAGEQREGPGDEGEGQGGGAPASDRGETRPAQKGWRDIGRNQDGNPVYEDERGVRSFVNPQGIRITEKVAVRPDGGISVDTTNRDLAYQPVEAGGVVEDAGKTARGELPIEDDRQRQRREKAGSEPYVSSVRETTEQERKTEGRPEAKFTAVAQRERPWSSERGFGRTEDEAIADAMRRLGVKPEPVKSEAPGTAPEHQAELGVDDRELSEIVAEFNAAQAAMVEDDQKVTHVFDPPEKSEIVRLNNKSRVYHKDHGWMTPAEAKAKIAEWKAAAEAQGDDPAIRSANSRKVVLSLFDLSGQWSQPWEDAGYQVFRFDIQADPDMGDVHNFSTEFFGDWFGDFDGEDIYAVLAACPCTDFASSGARHFAAKDADGRTVKSVKLVHQTLAAIEYFKPAVWAIENPVGRIEKLGGLPPWRLSFDPNDVGDPYTKKTLLWGRFNADLPIAPVEPTEGSKMWARYGGKSMATKNARSETPEGFAYSFFMANNAHDHPAMALANKFDRLDRDLIERAIKAGVTPEAITEAVEDFYYIDLDDAAANDAIRALIPSGPTVEKGADGKDQTVIPGAEKISDKALAEKRGGEKMRPKVEQKDVGGLFGDSMDQADIFDAKPAPKADDVADSAAQEAVRAVISASGYASDMRDAIAGGASDADLLKLFAENVGQAVTGASFDGGSATARGRTLEILHADTDGNPIRTTIGNKKLTQAIRDVYTDDGVAWQDAKPGDLLRGGYGRYLVRKGIRRKMDANALVEHLGKDAMRALDGHDKWGVLLHRPITAEEADAAWQAVTGKPEPVQKKSDPTIVTEGQQVDPIVAAIRDRLIDPDGGFATINQARKFALDQGYKVKNEATANKEIEELIEHAVVMAARDIIRGGKARGPAVIYDRLVGIYDRQPRLASRTSQSMAEQAYSTPVPLAYIASRLAGVSNGGTVLEPTAGNGALLIEADPEAAIANELNDVRADNLEAQGFTVTREDATGAMDFAGMVDTIIANPPFGAVREAGQSRVFDVGGLRTTAIDQAIALNSLSKLKPNGRAVFIVGSVKDGTQEQRSEYYNTSQKRKFYKNLYDDFNVTNHFTVSGSLYQKQGAGWPVDVIVIDGKGKSSLKLPAVEVPPVVNSWGELKGYLDAVRARSPQAGKDSEQVPASAGEKPEPVSRDTGGGKSAAGGGAVPRSSEPAVDGAAGGAESDRGQRGGVRGDRPGAALEGGRNPAGDRQRAPARQRKPLVSRTPNESGQVGYDPFSNEGRSLNTLVPQALGASMEESLTAVSRRRGNIDDYVAEALGYDVTELSDVFSAEQIDAIALGLDNIEKGEGFIIGDQTGIGKGRFVAAMIRFAHRRGHTPIFVTEKPDLYGDMFRDLNDIRWPDYLGRDPNIFMTNAGTSVPLDDEAIEWIAARDLAQAQGEKAPPRRGTFMPTQTAQQAEVRMNAIVSGREKVDVVFTTYDQMNTVKGAETSRRAFMDQMAGKAFLIMDEAHNAGGQGEAANARAKKDAPAPRSKKFREWVAKAQSVLYSSATYAKNPQVMDLYSRTDMVKAVEEPKDLAELIIRGGVPMQQVVASMLARSGQYARREKSFEGIDYGIEEIAVDADQYAAFADAISQIYRFDTSISDFRKEWIDAWLKENAAGMSMDGGLGEMAANSTEFASIMHNIVNQMMLSIKADGAADRAIRALKDGEKPVIALATTNESFIKDYIENAGIEFGDTIDLTFRDMLLRYLDRTLRITVKESDDTKRHIQIPPTDLDPSDKAAYDAARRAILDMDLSALPVSPIDWMRGKLERAGYSVREITGRSTMIEYGANGGMTLTQRPKGEQGSSGKRVTIKAYNDGKVDAVIINKSGSTGVSMHSSEKFKDQRRRRMILVQADPNPDTHMQMLGRVNRTGQVNLPAYSQMSADIPAEARPTAIILKKMASLNANTTGARKSKFSADAVDFMNEYGDVAAVSWAKANPETNSLLGTPVAFDEKGKVTTPNAIQRLTGRLMLLNPADQQKLIDTLTETYNSILAQKEALGENALEAKTLDLDARVIERKIIKPGREGGSPFEGPAYLNKVDVKAAGRALPPKEVIERLEDKFGRKLDGQTWPQKLKNAEGWGREWLRKQDERMRGEHAEYVKWVVGGLKKAEAKQNQTDKANEQYARWRQIMNTVPLGRHVAVKAAGNLQAEEMQAVVIDISSSDKAKSPTALSSWSVTFAVPDNARELTVPFSQIKTASDPDIEGETGLRVTLPNWTANTAQLERDFDAASKEGRETRYIITGNILAGYDQVNAGGQVVQFTNAEGGTQPGILMKKTWSQEDWAANRKVILKTPDQVMAFLAESEDKTIQSRDGVITIENTYRGYEIEMPAARRSGGAYFTDASVRAIYDSWQKSGNKMVARVDAATAKRLIEAFQQIGAVFAATSDQQTADRITGNQVDYSPRGWEAAGGFDPVDIQVSREDMREIRQIVEQVAGTRAVEFWPTIDVPAGAEGAAAGWNRTDSFKASGFYNGAADMIAIALDTPDSQGIAYHEAFHRLQRRFLTDAEKRLLVAEKERLRAMVAGVTRWDRATVARMAQTEIEAEAFRIFASGNPAGVHIGIRRAWQALAEIIRRVRNYLQGRGFKTSEDVFRAAKKGTIARRGGQGAAAGTDFQPAYHGTPHRFDRFSTEKIGTGEGAQSFGWGLYFAGKRDVAEYYRDTLTQRNAAIRVDGKVISVPPKVEDRTAEQVAALIVSNTLRDGQEMWVARQRARNALMQAREGDVTEFQREGGWGDVDKLAKAFEIIEGWQGRDVKLDKGSLFTVDVPENDELMLWDAPLSEQPEAAKAFFRDRGMSWGESKEAMSARLVGMGLTKQEADDYAQANFYDATGQMAYRELAQKLGSDRAASEALRDAGIPGHRFLDQGSRNHRALAEARGSLSIWESALKKNPDDAYIRGEVEALRKEVAEIEKGISYNYVIYDEGRISVSGVEFLPQAPKGTPPRKVPAAALGQRMVHAVKKMSSKDRKNEGDGESFGDYSHRKWIDYLHPVLQMQKAVHAALSDYQNAYMQARLSEDAALAEIQTMHDTYVMPVLERLGKAGGSLEELHRYMYALHAEERNVVVGLRNPKGSDLNRAAYDTSVKGASGWSTDEARRVVLEYRRGDPDKYRALIEAARSFRQMIDTNLDRQRRAGLISNETYDTLRQQWKHYVPLKGTDGMDDDGYWTPAMGGTGFDVRGKEFKGAVGRFSEADNVLVNAIAQNERAILRAHKNDVGKAVLRFLNDFDPEGDNLAEVYWTHQGDLGDITKAPEVYKRVIGKDGQVTSRKMPNPFAAADDVLAVKVAGRSYFIRFRDVKVGEALRKMHKAEIGTVSKMVRKVTMLQSLVNTRMNPGFIPINIIRDAQTGAVHLLDEGFSVGDAARVVGNIPKAWGALWRRARKKPPINEWDEIAAEYVAHGGRITFDNYRTLEESMAELNAEIIRAANGGRKPSWQRFIDVIRDLNDAGENGMRLAAYAAARKKGRTAKNAAFMARDLTVDFKKHGELGPAMNSWYVFFNSALQGNYNIARRLAKSRRVKAAVGAFIFAGMMQHAWNEIFAGDDEDGENRYHKMLKNEPWKLERQMVFFIPGGNGKYFSFPLPYGYNAFHHLGVQGAAVAAGAKSIGSGVLDSFRVAFSAFNPIGSGSVATMVAPTIADPAVELVANENFFGAPIYPEQSHWDQSPAPDSQMSFKSTNPVFIEVAEALNALTGGNDVEPGLIDVHPDSLEHLWGFFTGGIGRFVSQSAQTVSAPFTGDEIEPEKVPWVRSFYGEIDEQSQRTEYFRMREDVQEAKGWLKDYRDSGRADEASSLYRRRAGDIDAIAAFDQAEKQRRAINKRRRQIEADEAMTRARKDELLDGLDAQEIEAMRQARIAYTRAHQKARER